MDYLEKYAKYGWLDLEKLKASDKYKLIEPLPRWKEIEKNMLIKRAKYGVVRAKLEYIRQKDQCLRRLLPAFEKEFPGDSTMMDYYFQIMGREDSLNLIEAKKILDEHGLLGIDKVGTEGAAALWLVIQHATLAEQEKYLPMLERAVEEGELVPYQLAYLKDRIRMRQGKRQIYGSQFATFEGKRVLYPVENLETINETRRAIGLGRIEDYVEFADATIAPEEQSEQIMKEVYDDIDGN